MRVWIPVLVLLAWATPALADEAADLKQTATDLSSQLDDKQRLDTQGALKVELNQARTWLGDAGNAIKEEKEELARKVFERIRAQLKLMDQRIALSQLQVELSKLQQGLQNARKALQAAKQQLEEKRVQLKAMKINQPK